MNFEDSKICEKIEESPDYLKIGNLGKLECKVQIHITGMQKRASELLRALESNCAELASVDGMMKSYGKLSKTEEQSAERRIALLRANISLSAEREISSQALHGKLVAWLADCDKVP